MSPGVAYVAGLLTGLFLWWLFGNPGGDEYAEADDALDDEDDDEDDDNNLPYRGLRP